MKRFMAFVAAMVMAVSFSLFPAISEAESECADCPNVKVLIKAGTLAEVVGDNLQYVHINSHISGSGVAYLGPYSGVVNFSQDINAGYGGDPTVLNSGFGLIEITAPDPCHSCVDFQLQ